MDMENYAGRKPLQPSRLLLPACLSYFILPLVEGNGGINACSCPLSRNRNGLFDGSGTPLPDECRTPRIVLSSFLP